MRLAKAPLFFKYTGSVAERAWLAEAARRLAGVPGVERVYLFGSFARGRATRRSDLDLLVVWRTDLPTMRRIGALFDLLKDAPRPLELVVLTPEEFEARKDLPFLRGVMREAVVLYERGKTREGGEAMVPAGGG